MWDSHPPTLSNHQPHHHKSHLPQFNTILSQSVLEVLYHLFFQFLLSLNLPQIFPRYSLFPSPDCKSLQCLPQADIVTFLLFQHFNSINSSVYFNYKLRLCAVQFSLPLTNTSLVSVLTLCLFLGSFQP